MTRLRDVAKLADVSTATASRALSGNGFVSEELRQRVLAAVQELDYSPNAIARSMTQQRTHTLGLVVSDVTNPYFTEVARAVADVAEVEGYSLVLCNTDEETRKERMYLSVLREKRVDGILLALSGLDASHIRSLTAAGTHVVLIDRVVPDVDVPWVKVDNATGVRQAVEYLIGLGHGRIAIVTGRMQVSVAGERLQAYRLALETAGIPVDEDLVVSGHFTEAGGRSAGLRLMSMSSPPTAIISSNNLMTTGLLLTLRERRIRVPHDVSVISFDDLPYFQLLERPLTAVAQPTYEMGRLACQLLLRVIQGESNDSLRAMQVQLSPQLVVRSSCRAPDGRSGGEQI